MICESHSNHTHFITLNIVFKDGRFTVTEAAHAALDELKILQTKLWLVTNRSLSNGTTFDRPEGLTLILIFEIIYVKNGARESHSYC